MLPNISNNHGALIFRVKQSKFLDTCPITKENMPFSGKTIQQLWPPAISSTTSEQATVKFRYSVQCNVLAHSRTAVVMTKTACIHWEFVSSFFLGSSTYPTSQNVIKLLDIMSSKLFANHSIYTQFYKHLTFVLQHYSSFFFFYFTCLFYRFIIWVFICISNSFH